MANDVQGYEVGMGSAGVYPSQFLLTAGTVRASTGPASPMTQE